MTPPKSVAGKSALPVGDVRPSAPPPKRAAAQTSAPSAETSTVAPGQEEVVQLSAFEVRTTANTGYSPGNIAQALRSNSNLMDTPNQIIVVTNDLIKDIGADNSSDILAFAGIGSYYRGPTPWKCEARASPAPISTARPSA